jgi:hypothetical protein
MDYLNWLSPYLSFIFMHVYYIFFLCFCVFLCMYSQFFRILSVRYFSFQTDCDFLNHVIYAIYLVKVMSVLLLAQDGRPQCSEVLKFISDTND